MNKSMLTIGIIFLSIIALLLINVLSNYSRGSELDYYLVKETTDAAITDSLDTVYLRTCGLPRIDKEKFVESFLYRFAANVDITRGYTIGFYDINEVPPKVSIKVDSLTTLNFDAKGTGEAQTPDITTSYDAIVESTYPTDSSVEYGLLNTDYSDLCKNLFSK